MKNIHPIKKWSAGIFLISINIAAANAATIWTDWTSATVGTNGTAVGLLGSTNVNYNGQLIGAVTNGTTTVWNPSTSYLGGSVDVTPDSVGDLLGISQSTGTITFSSPVLNPVIAFWSLGAPGSSASFVFNQNPALQSGGPNTIYGGSSIYVVGNTVFGNEGNGVVMFQGTFSSLSWTSSPEYWYGITVGTASPVPVPAAIWLFASGILGLTGLSKFKRKR